MAAKFRGYKPQPPKQVQLSPALQQKFQQALTLHQKGMTTQAQAFYEEILKSQPKHFDSLHLLGVCRYQSGQLLQSVELISAAIIINPDYALAYNNRGNSLKALERFDEAIVDYEKVISLKPDFAEAHFNRGNLLQTLKRLDEAIASYNKAISLKADFAEAYNNRGDALQGLKQLDEAIVNYNAAIRLKCEYAEAYYNRGIALHGLRQLDEAIVSYRKAISLKSDSADAYYNCGNALQDLRRLDEALASFERAVSLKPGYAEAYNNRGNVLKDLKRLDEALASYDKATSLKPDIKYLLGSRLHTKIKLCDWNELDADLTLTGHNVLAGSPSVNPWITLGLFDSPQMQQTAAKIYVESEFNSQQRVIINPSERASPTINIGYFSSDFRNHAMSFLLAEMFEEHSRQDFRFHGFAYGPKSDDPMRKRVSSAFDTFTEINNKSDDEVFTLCREHQIDIAVDLNGFTNHSRTSYFAERCAPIQVNYLGFAGTMGTNFIDYIIADHTLIPPESQQFYAEKVVYLPHSYQVNDSKRRISDRVFSRHELGLPDTGFVFCCFNNNWKILPEVFDAWTRFLKAVDGSVLWLLEDNPTAARNLRKEAADRGIDPQRLVFAQRMPLDEHLARHRCADLFLDTLPYNAHTTASDALWAGLPVLTQIGQSFAARVAASLLNAMDLPELITHSREEYEAKALEIALNPDKLSAIKAKVAVNRTTSPLFDAKLFARHIEAAYREMIRRYDAGLKPEVIEVSKDGIATSPDM